MISKICSPTYASAFTTAGLGIQSGLRTGLRAAKKRPLPPPPGIRSGAGHGGAKLCLFVQAGTVGFFMAGLFETGANRKAGHSPGLVRTKGGNIEAGC